MTLTRRIILGLSIVGLLLSTYLTYEHFADNASMLCSATAAVDCVRVTTSSYSRLWGIPVAILGLLFYLAMTALCAITKPNQTIVRLRAIMSISGLVMVGYLVWAEMQVGAICLWCTGVHITTLALVVLTVTDVLAPE